MRAARLAWLGLAACSAPSSPAAAPSQPSAAQHAPPTAPRNRVAVRWSNIATVEGCFYFRGPTSGRDARLGTLATLDVDGPIVRLGFPDATFVGVAGDGGEVHLVYASQHVYHGAWSVTEHIDGRLVDGTLRGRYRYEECESGNTCPGRCTTTAELVTRWRDAR